MMFDSGANRVMKQRRWGRSRVSFRSRTLALAVAILATMASRASEAQAPPQGAPPQVAPPQTAMPTDEQQIEIPKLDVVPIAPVPNTEQQHNKIRAALDGGVPVTDGDPVLDDLLQLIRRRGSVLDGTALDPSNDFEASGPHASEAKSTDPITLEDDKAFAAESLLRSARLLSQLGVPDAARRELITQMRQEAAKLLAP